MDKPDTGLPAPAGEPARLPQESDEGEERWDVYLPDGKTGEMFRRSDGRGGFCDGKTNWWGTWADGFLYLDARDRDGGFIRLDRYAGRTVFTGEEADISRAALTTAKPAVAFLRATLDELGVDHGSLTDDRLDAAASAVARKLKLIVCSQP